MRTLAIATALMLSAACKSHPPVELGLTLLPGQSFGVVMVVEQEIEQDFGEAQLQTNQLTRTAWRQEVESVRPDGTAVVAFTYESARFVLEGPQFGRMEYDSENPGDVVPAPALGMEAMLGERMRVEIAPNGEIVSTADVEALMERVIAKLVVPPTADAARVKASLRRRFGGNGVREMLQSVFAVYPDGPVAVGDTWTRKTRVTGAYPHEQENVYELVRLDDDSAKIRVRSRLTPLRNSAPIASGPMKTEVEVGGSQRGFLRVDLETGMVVVAELTQELRGEVRMTMPGAEPVRAEIEVSAKIELAVGD